MIKKLTGLLFFLLITSFGCSNYKITVQGVDLDHFLESRPVSTTSADLKKQAAAHNDLGVILEREGDLIGALEHYRIAREQDPDMILAYINAGNVYVKLNRLSAAEDLYRKALSRDSDQTVALNNLAWVYILRRENLPEAISLLEKAIQVDQIKRYQYLDSLGWAIYMTGDSKQAIATLKTALEETPPEEKYLLAEAHYHLGLIYHARGDRDLGKEHLRKSLEIHPYPERESEIAELMD